MGLLNFLFGNTPQQPPTTEQPKGLLGNAGAAMANRSAYMDYATQMQSKGIQPLTFDAWVKMQQNIQNNNFKKLPGPPPTPEMLQQLQQQYPQQPPQPPQ